MLKLRHVDLGIPANPDLSAGIYFRHLELEPAEWGAHRHPWGQWNYLTHGVMNMTVAGQSFLSPPQYALWIPPYAEHASSNATRTTYRTAYLSLAFSRKLPAYPCAMTVSPLLRAVLDEFSRLDVRVPATPPHRRMAQVALDQIERATQISAYLPGALSDGLRVIFDFIGSDLSRRMSTLALARRFHMTARTLERRCAQETGMGLGEWQQRLRFMQSLEALDAGVPIKQIAAQLGYSSPSVFIAMFRGITGSTPDQYRKTK